MSTSKPRFAVVLSGCGVFDGTEIHEAVLTMLAIARQGGEYRCFAPDVEQHHVVNHLTGTETGETRNVLVESARIARGKVEDLRKFDPAQFDALVMPGGFGAAKNLSSFAVDGPGCTVNSDVADAVRKTHAMGKPVGALCIAPVILAKVLGGGTLTIGEDQDTASAIEAMGARHKKTGHAEVVVDREQRLVTTPCYMLDARIDQIAEGAENAVRALIELARSPAKAAAE